MKKKFLSILLALAMCLSLLPTAAFATESEGGTPEGTKLTSSNTELTGGTYYLDENVTLSQTLTVKGEVTLDLNGHVLMLNSSTYGGTATGSVIEVADGGKLTLIDSAPTATHYFYTKTDSVLWRWDKDATTKPEDTADRKYYTVTGGVITGGSNQYGGGIHVVGSETDANKSTLTMTGGSIIGCTSVCGGGVYVGGGAKKGTFIMNGGSIIGCAASMQGGGVFVSSGNDGGSSFTLKAGTIQECVSKQYDEGANCLGAGVYNAGTFDMKGGEIKDCTIKVTNADELKMAAGGGIYDCGTFTLSGGEISGCSAGNSGISVGDGIYLDGSKTLADVVSSGYTLEGLDNLIQGACGNVKVVAHTCNFATENNGKWTCACGRSNTKQSVLYLDEKGKQNYCHEYTEIDENSKPTTWGESGETKWYYVKENATINTITLKGDVHLILGDSKTLSATTITDSYNEGRDLTVYAQSTDSSMGKLAVNNTSGDGIKLHSSLTIHGGDVSATGSSTEGNDTSGIFVGGNMTVTGGSVAATGEYRGIYLYSTDTGRLAVEGGTVKATSTARSNNGGKAIYCGNLAMSGGSLTADSDANSKSSFGIYVVANMEVTGGTLTATGNEVRGGESYGIKVGGLANITGGEITAKSETAANGSTGTSYGFQCDETLTVSGGKLTATGGAANSASEEEVDSFGLDCDGDLTVSGGTIIATAGAANNPSGKVFSIGLNCEGDLSVTDGAVRATSGAANSIANSAFSYGLYCDKDLTVEDGKITANAGTASGKAIDNSNEIQSALSYGAVCMKNLNVSGGKITATGSTATIDLIATNNGMSGSYGLLVNYNKDISTDAIVSGGSIVAKGGMAADKNGTSTNKYTCSVGFYCGTALTISDGSIAGTGDSAYFASYGIIANKKLTANGGTLTAKTEATNAVYDMAITSDADITLGTDMEITKPTGGKVGSMVIDPNYPTDKIYFVADQSGTAAKEAVIEKKTASGDDTGNNSGSSSSGGSSSNTTSTTVKNPDGSTTTTTTDKKTGTVTETTKDTNGVTGTTVTDKNGTVTDISANIPASAAKDGDSVPLPIDAVKPADSENAPTITVDVPKGGATIEIPVENPTPGTVVVIVNKDGSETVIPTSKVTENGIEVTLTEDATIKVIDNSKTFTDVPANAYFANAVKWAAARGITGGITATTFGPHLSCTRAQLVTFLWRAAGQPEATSASGMTDVSADAYYSEAVAWAFENGIVGGYGNGLFGVNDTITRQQMAVILYRFAQAMGMDTTQGGMAVREFSDYESISDYAIAAMQWAVNAGILQGNNGYLNPTAPCTRAQIVTMLYRLLGNEQ